MDHQHVNTDPEYSEDEEPDDGWNSGWKLRGVKVEHQHHEQDQSDDERGFQ